MIRILLLGLAAALSACTLPGKPGPLPGRDQCQIEAVGVVCSDVPRLPIDRPIVHE